MPLDNPKQRTMDAAFAAMWSEDKFAKAAGTLIGRVVKHPHADGNAYYRIIGVTKTAARMEVVTGIGDDWVLPAWGERPTVKLSWIMNHLAHRDTMDELVAENDAKRRAIR